VLPAHDQLDSATSTMPANVHPPFDIASLPCLLAVGSPGPRRRLADCAATGPGAYWVPMAFSSSPCR